MLSQDATNFRRLTVFDSSSLMKTWAKPDMLEKKITIQKREETILAPEKNCPTAKLTAVRVTTANITRALRPYLVLSSDLISF